MKKHFEILRVTRANLLKVTHELSLDQLNHILPGFNNNIAWQLGHVLVTQQRLCYGLAGQEMRIEPEIVDLYRKGSRPEEWIEQASIDYIREMIVHTSVLIESDFNSHLFTGYKEYPTSYGITLTSIEDAIHFNNIHEAMHFGMVKSMLMAMR